MVRSSRSGHEAIYTYLYLYNCIYIYTYRTQLSNYFHPTLISSSDHQLKVTTTKNQQHRNWNITPGASLPPSELSSQAGALVLHQVDATQLVQTLAGRDFLGEWLEYVGMVGGFLSMFGNTRGNIGVSRSLSFSDIFGTISQFGHFLDIWCNSYWEDYSWSQHQHDDVRRWGIPIGWFPSNHLQLSLPGGKQRLHLRYFLEMACGFEMFRECEEFACICQIPLPKQIMFS